MAAEKPLLGPNLVAGAVVLKNVHFTLLAGHAIEDHC
jgi:hypothetical protein